MKVPLFCSLIPAELLASRGVALEAVDAAALASVPGSAHHGALHENICAYAKALCDFFEARHGGYDLIVLPVACDALRRLASVLEARVPAERLFILDVPKNKGELAERYLAEGFRRLDARLRERGPEAHQLPSPPEEGRTGVSARHRVGIIGSNADIAALEELVREGGAEVVHLNHCLVRAHPERQLLDLLLREGVEAYARAFWRRNSCPRTNDDDYKASLVERIREERIDGVVVNAFKFCDYQPFEYRHLKGVLGQDFPMVLLEHEFGAAAEGQMRTRIEAFLEKIKGVAVEGRPTRAVARDAGYFVGIDSGSNATKLVCVDRDERIVAQLLVPTGTSVSASAATVLASLQEEHGIGSGSIARIVGTGYGREAMRVADATVTEISCHALGAHYRLRGAATLIDVGGQDSKAIRVDGEGRVIRFAMNDKCAAGTGRFLEVMAQKLEVSLEAFAALAVGAGSAVPISSMCSVFAESEVISLIAEGKPKDGIARGVHEAIAARTASLCKRIAGEPPYSMAGGVAKNGALVRALAACLGAEVAVLPDPQFSGALGAALLACRSAR